MRAVVLVGGEGRRLRPLTDTRPKPMMNLVDRPFVAHQLDLLHHHGITEVVFSCGYRPDALRDYFGDGAARGMSIHYVVDPEPLGTAGAIRNARELLDGSPVLVLNGDILTDLDIGGLIAQHRSTGARGTIALTPVEDPSAFGLVRLHDDLRVAAFVEKPSPEQLIPGEPFRINAGTYVLEPEVVESIPAGVACSIEREIFPVLAERGALYGHPSGAYWRDIGTPASYLGAHLDVLSGVARTEAPAGGCYVGGRSLVDAAAELDEVSCIGGGCMVGAGARIRGSVVGDGTRVDAGALLDGAIVGADVVVGEGARLEPGSVVGDRAQIAPGAVVGSDERVPTGGRIAAGAATA